MSRTAPETLCGDRVSEMELAFMPSSALSRIVECKGLCSGCMIAIGELCSGCGE